MDKQPLSERLRDRVDALRQWSETPTETANKSVREIAQDRQKQQTANGSGISGVALGWMIIFTVISVVAASLVYAQIQNVRGEIRDINSQTLQIEAESRGVKDETDKLPKVETITHNLEDAQKSADAIAEIQTTWIHTPLDTADGNSEKFIREQSDKMKKHVTDVAVGSNNFSLLTSWFSPQKPTKRDRTGAPTAWEQPKKGDFTWSAIPIKSIDADGTVRAAWQLKEKDSQTVLAWATAVYAGGGKFGGFVFSVTAQGQEYAPSTESDAEDTGGTHVPTDMPTEGNA